MMWENIKGYSSEIASVIGAILNGDAEGRSARVAKAVAESFATAKDRQGPALQGAHANGWISVYAKQSAEAALAALAPAAASTEPEVTEAAAVLATALTRVAQLQTAGHDPWLRGDWQLNFQAITVAVATALSPT